VSVLVPFFTGQVDAGGQLVFDDFGAFSRHVATMKGRRVRISVRRFTGTRTLPQNARLWMIYTAISDWSGHDTEEIHEAMKHKFLPYRTLETPKGSIAAPPSTRVLSISDFASFMERVEAWAAEQGCVMPNWEKVE